MQGDLSSLVTTAPWIYANSTADKMSILLLLNSTNGSTNSTTEALNFANAHIFMDNISLSVSVIFALITASGLIGNTLVMIVLHKHPKLMSYTTNMLVFNLAVADLSFILICVPFTAVRYATPIWVFGDVWCKIVQYMSSVCIWASVYTLVLMCVDRLLAIVFATQIGLSRLRTKRNTIIAIAVMWIVVCLANIPTMMFNGAQPYQHNGRFRKTCVFLDKENNRNRLKIYQHAFFVFGFMLPVALISILYGVLIAFLMKRTTPGGKDSKNIKGQSQARKVTVTVVTVVSVYIVCWLPINVILVMSNDGGYPQTPNHIIVQVTANCLAYMNSCLNPVLYIVSSTVFREAFFGFLCRKRIQNKNTAESTNNARPSNLRSITPNMETSCTALSSVHISAQKDDNKYIEETIPLMANGESVRVVSDPNDDVGK